jgi:hypothetical protein
VFYRSHPVLSHLLTYAEQLSVLQPPFMVSALYSCIFFPHLYCIFTLPSLCPYRLRHSNIYHCFIIVYKYSVQWYIRQVFSCFSQLSVILTNTWDNQLRKGQSLFWFVFLQVPVHSHSALMFRPMERQPTMVKANGATKLLTSQPESQREWRRGWVLQSSSSICPQRPNGPL